MNIKEIEERSGLTRANIRYYEQEGLLAPARRENKYRDYSEEDLETLLRIALLRNLGFSLDEIRRLQSGELELAAAMRERSAALESEGQRLLAARNVCDAISREVTSYSALRPEDYLNGFEPDAAAKQRDVAEPHPLRRYLARGASGLVRAVCAAAPQLHNCFPVGGHRLRSDRLGIAGPP